LKRLLGVIRETGANAFGRPVAISGANMVKINGRYGRQGEKRLPIECQIDPEIELSLRVGEGKGNKVCFD
jgi:hypothetical protein